MEDDGRVLARLDHFVQVADATLAHRACERTVAPHGAALADQVATDEIGCGEIVVAGHGKQRQAEARGHVGDEAGLAATGGALDEQGQTVLPGVLEDLDLVRGGLVEGDVEVGRVGLHCPSPLR